MKRLLLFFIIFPLIVFKGYAETKIAISNGGNGWSNNNNWLTTGVPASGDTVIIPPGIIISIKNNVYNGTQVDLVVLVYGTLRFEPSGRLELWNKSEFQIFNSGKIISSGASSEQIVIGGILKFNGRQDGAINGPAFASISTHTTPNGFTNQLVLPIKLVSFTHQKNSNQVLLNWELVMDKEHGTISVEKSENDGKWVSVHEVKISGSPGRKIQDSFITEKSKNDVSFRLRVSENDGSIFYSNIIKINGSHHGNKTLLFPNPAINDHADLLFTTTESRDIWITGINGQIYRVHQNYTHKQLRLEYLEKGVYIIRVLHKITHETETLRLVVSR